MITMAREEAERLNRLVGNLLDMTPNSKACACCRTSREPCDIQEVVSAALDWLAAGWRAGQVTVDAQPVLAPMDFVSNVAGAGQSAGQRVKYSPPSAPIEHRCT